MARTHLTLAALATAAVPGLDVVAASRFGSAGQGDYDSALLTGRGGEHWVVRVPRSERAETEQSADLLAVRALSAGIRSRLPFDVAGYLGQAPARGTRAVVYDFVPGTTVPLASYSTRLADSVGRAVAAIHALPTSFVADAGLPVLSAIECLRACVSVMDRATASGLVPAILLRRWESAAEEQAMWQFAPTVINGALTSDSVLSSDGEVTGIIGWHELRVGDPARDLAWVLGARGDQVAESAFDAYSRVRGNIDRQVRQRAMLYAELELAKWLLHGIENRDTTIVDDAADMLSGLADKVQHDIMNPLATNSVPTVAPPTGDVEALLARSDRAS